MYHPHYVDVDDNFLYLAMLTLLTIQITVGGAGAVHSRIINTGAGAVLVWIFVGGGDLD